MRRDTHLDRHLIARRRLQCNSRKALQLWFGRIDLTGVLLGVMVFGVLTGRSTTIMAPQLGAFCQRLVWKEFGWQAYHLFTRLVIHMILYDVAL